MSFLPPNSSVLEIIYYCSSPAAAIIGIIALLQVVELKKQNKIAVCQSLNNDEKESFQKATDLCYFFKQNIIDNNYDFSSIKKLGLIKEIESKTPKEFTTIELVNEYSSGRVSLDFISKQENIALHKNAIDVLNYLEYFSMPFISEIAAEDIAFPPMHRLFCNTVEILYPYICHHNNSPDSRVYNNAIKLYLLWKSRLLEAKEINKGLIEKNVTDTTEASKRMFAPRTRKYKKIPAKDAGI